MAEPSICPSRPSWAWQRRRLRAPDRPGGPVLPSRAWAVAIVGYFVLVSFDVVLRRGIGLLDPTALGSSPARISAGEVGRLFTSGLIVAGSNPGIQLAGAVAVTGLFVYRHGARSWWGAALSGHLGSALAAYALIGLLFVLDAASVDQVLDQPDFGISCVLAGTLGGLVAGAALRLRRGVPEHRLRRELAVTIGGVAAFLAFIPFSLGYYGIEHPLAFGFGALFMVVADRWAARRASVRADRDGTKR